jgi:hypothetical protein
LLAHNTGVLRTLITHIQWVCEQGAWREHREDEDVRIFWRGEGHPLARLDLTYQIPSGWLTAVGGLRVKPRDGEGDGIRGTVILKGWRVRRFFGKDMPTDADMAAKLSAMLEELDSAWTAIPERQANMDGPYDSWA